MFCAMNEFIQKPEVIVSTIAATISLFGLATTIWMFHHKIDETCLVFNVDTYKSVKPQYLPMFNRLRLNYRNGNLEMDAICDYNEIPPDKLQEIVYEEPFTDAPESK